MTDAVIIATINLVGVLGVGYMVNRNVTRKADRTVGKLEEVHKQIDGRMEQLLEAKKAEGKLEEKIEQEKKNGH